jgi:DNA invertase Pin-like site-specific DNA recombinase
MMTKKAYSETDLPSPTGWKIGYARVSTLDQNLDLQLDALKRVGCKQIYQETASGRAAGRPELENCLKAIRPGDRLVVWKLDRLGRSLPDLVDIINGLAKSGVFFESLTENIDTGSASGRLIFHIFAALADFERSLIRERTLAGLEAARRKGRVGGRPRKLTPEAIADARKAINGGMTMKAAAKLFGVSKTTLFERLRAEDMQN